MTTPCTAAGRALHATRWHLPRCRYAMAVGSCDCGLLKYILAIEASGPLCLNCGEAADHGVVLGEEVSLRRDRRDGMTDREAAEYGVLDHQPIEAQP